MSDRPRLLDLFCGGGGASMGYWLAGFEVVGVDIAKRGRYPFAHFQADALEFARLYGGEFDAIHASPPCQAYSRLAARHPEREYPDLVAATREALQVVGKPYVIENVPEAPLLNAYVLCGSSFGLGTRDYQLRRHRAFETTFPLMIAPCSHDARPVISVAGHSGRAGRNLSGTTVERREAMQIPWLASDAIAEALPPDYTYYIGRQLLDHLALREEAVVSSPEHPAASSSLRLAYADPPYPGKAHLYPENTEVDHGDLIAQLGEYDGWALSTDETSLQYVLALCPPKVRVLAWCISTAPPLLPFPIRSWEPVIVVPGRTRNVTPVRSFYVSGAPTAYGRRQAGLTGQKPSGFCEWVLRALGVEDGDSLDDLFPGSEIMNETFIRVTSQPQLFMSSGRPNPTAQGKMLRRTHPALPGFNPPSRRSSLISGERRSVRDGLG